MDWVISVITTVGSIILTLTVTTCFNYFVKLPKKYKEERDRQQRNQELLIEENKCRDARIAALEEATSHYPEYREQSRQIQEALQTTDRSILEICNAIKEDVIHNREKVLEKLERLEAREKNALRAKILEEYRLYTDEVRNPMHAWSEMESHSFLKLVEDYEALGGNDYVHSVVLPEIYKLDIISMHNLEKLQDLYDSRRMK